MTSRHHKKYTSRTLSGFTIIELLITIVIAAILVGIAVPSFKSFIERNRLVTTSDEIFSAITYARVEAVKRRTNVTFCAKNSDATQTCEPLGTNADYANGWLIFQDCNTNGVFDSCDTTGDGVADTPEELIKIADAYKGSLSVTNSNTTVPCIRFGISGRVSAGVGTLSFDTSDSVTFKTLDITRSGSSYFN